MFAIVALVLAVLIGGVAAFFQFNAPGAPDMVPAGEVLSLPYQDNTAFNEWKRMAGGRWAVLPNDDKESVIQGDGVLIRRFPDLATKENDDLQHYRLELVVELHEAKIAEVHVDFPGKPATGPTPHTNRRVVLRLTPQGSQLGIKRTDLEGWVPRSTFVPLRKTRYDKHAVRLERHTAGWWVFVDDTPIGFDFSRASRDGHEFRLIAEDGEAWFSDFVISELRPKSAEPPKSPKAGDTP
jgi:hypothetical protein